MGRASGTSVTCYVHGDKSPYTGVHHSPNIYLKFTATVTRNGMDIKVTLSNMTFKALGGYGYPMTVYAMITTTSHTDTGWVKLDKSTATTAVTWTRHPSNKTLSIPNDANTEVYVHIGAYSSDAKHCFPRNPTQIARYTWDAPAANYTLTYNANGGSNAPASVTVTPGGSVIVTDEKPYANLVLDYYKATSYTEIDFSDTLPFTFLNWNTAADGSGDTYVAGQEITDINNNITLYAQWDPISYVIKPFNNPLGIDITFNPTGGVVVPQVHRVSYNQSGYAINPIQAAVLFIPGQTYTFLPRTSALPLFQIYDNPRIATVTATDLPPRLAGSTISKAGYAFIGWYFESTLETQIVPPYNTANDFTLYAKWKPLPIYIKTEDGWTPEDDNTVWQCVEVTESGETKKVWKKIAHIFRCIDDGSGNRIWKDTTE